MHRRLAARDARDHFAHVLHGGGGSEQPRTEYAGIGASLRVRQLDGGRHQLAQTRKIQRLGDEIECAQFQRAHGGLHVAMGGDHRDRNAGGVLLHPFHQFQARRRRATACPSGIRSNRSVLSSRCAAPIEPATRGARSHPLQGDREELANIRLVIDDEYGRSRHFSIVASHTDSMRYASQRCGSLKTTLKMLPPPLRGSYSRMARFSWHSSRAMNRPSPVPPLRPVKKGSKMRSARLRFYPGARSATSR